MKSAYYALCAAGTAVPLLLFFPWLSEHGLAIHLLVRTAFDTPVSAFAWSDVCISGLALLVFMAQEHRRVVVPLIWAPVLGLLTVGVSLALPLFLALRESAAPRRAS